MKLIVSSGFHCSHLELFRNMGYPCSLHIACHYLQMPDTAAVNHQAHTAFPLQKPALISNPLSYTNRKLGIAALEQLEAQLEQSGGWSACVHDDETLEDAIKVALNESCDFIIANGGDGTIQGTISTLARLGRHDIPIAVLPGGRTNVIAADLSMPKQVPAAFHQLLTDWKNHHLQLTQRPVLHIQHQNQPDRYGFLINGAGLASFIEECWAFREKYRRWGLYGGFGTGVWVVGRLLSALLGAQLFPTIDSRSDWFFDGQQKPGISTQTQAGMKAFSATTNEQLPLGISPYQGGNPSQQSSVSPSQSFKATAIEGSAQALAWRLIGGLLSGGKGYREEHGFLTGLPERLDIQSMVPMKYHLDGESYTLGKNEVLSIRLGPELNFVSGKKA